MSYEARITVRFGEIDHAGIVYYPRYFHYFHVAFEEFFGACAGVSYDALLNDRNVGFPTVRTEVDFRKGLVFGDVARIAVDVTHIGRSSLTMRYLVRKDGSEEVITEGEVTTACVAMDTFHPMPIPDDLRAVFEGHRVKKR